MKTSFSHTCKWALLLSTALSLSAWSAEAIYAKPGTSESIELSNLDEQGGIVSEAAPKGTATDNQAGAADPEAKLPADNKDSTAIERNAAGTNFSKVGKGGDISAEELATPGSPAKYRELVLNKATAFGSLNPNPAASRRFLAVDRATYQSRLGQ